MDGLIKILNPGGGISHNGMTLTMEGYVTVRKGLFASGALKPQLVCQITKELSKGGKITTQECNGIPFAVLLEPLAGQEIYETYHGHTLDIAVSLNLPTQDFIMNTTTN